MAFAFVIKGRKNQLKKGKWNMKKILCILTAIVLVFSISMLTSCDKEKNPDDDGVTRLPIVDY